MPLCLNSVIRESEVELIFLYAIIGNDGKIISIEAHIKPQKWTLINMSKMPWWFLLILDIMRANNYVIINIDLQMTLNYELFYQAFRNRKSKF